MSGIYVSRMTVNFDRRLRELHHPLTEPSVSAGPRRSVIGLSYNSFSIN